MAAARCPALGAKAGAQALESFPRITTADALDQPVDVASAAQRIFQGLARQALDGSFQSQLAGAPGFGLLQQQFERSSGIQSLAQRGQRADFLAHRP